MYVYKMNLTNDTNTPIEDYRLKLDLNTASYDEIYESWSHQYTDDGTNDGNYKLHEDSMLIKYVREYFKQKNENN